MRKVGAFIVGILVTAACAASAQDACRAEADKFCKDIQRGEGKVLKCLQAHESDLSDACKARLNTISQFMACIDDAMRFCPESEPVGGPAIKCLRLHETDLSTACKNELRKIRPQ